MGKSGIIVTGLVGIVLVVGGVVISKNKSGTDQTNSASTASSQNTSAASDQSSSTAVPSVATITYASSGFSPSTVTVKKGDTITIKNDSSDDIQFDSNPHPLHTDNTELNVGAVASGKSTTVTLNKVGTWGYHNHFNTSQKGTITVQ